ncbi:hypothetical protein TNCV_4271141 [Trichonephila clavipes]|nr:hypothetical protein TNCV_4271141 [Trichonephila clavipes]
MQRCFDIHLWISFTPNAAVLFVDVAIQPEVRLIDKQISLLKIGNNGNLVLDPFDESTPCLMIVLMNCQTKLRINHLTAVKSDAILETDEGAAKIFPEELAKIIEDGDYSADQVLNADETGLNWKKCLTVLTSQRMKKLQVDIKQRQSSDDEGDLEPLRKRSKPLSDSDND